VKAHQGVASALHSRSLIRHGTGQAMAHCAGLRRVPSIGFKGFGVSTKLTSARRAVRFQARTAVPGVGQDPRHLKRRPQAWEPLPQAAASTWR